VTLLLLLLATFALVMQKKAVNLNYFSAQKALLDTRYLKIINTIWGIPPAGTGIPIRRCCTGASYRDVPDPV